MQHNSDGGLVMVKSNLFWQVYLNLENEVIDLSKYIFFTDETSKNNKSVPCTHQLETYSSHIADLLLRCCVEIEAISKELYFDNGGIKPRGSKDIYFDTDCLALLNQLWNINNKVVMVVSSHFNLTKDENTILEPLKKADQRSKEYWAKAYQAVKHDRYNSLHFGNVKAVIQAMAALYLLNIYYQNITLSTKYTEIHKLDMSLGSKIFALKSPISGELWYGDIVKNTDSPYIVKYKDNIYKSLIKMQEEENKSFNDYWKSQEELKEPDFINQMTIALEEEKRNPEKRVMHLWELCKYRLNKKIPQNLSFEEKKERFCKSVEWTNNIRKINKHLEEDELTSENIQAEIEHAGILMGMALQQSLSNNWINFAMNGDCEIVLDKGNINYCLD